MRIMWVRLVVSVAGVVLMLTFAAPAWGGPFGALAPLDISAGDPYAGCPPIGAGVNYPDAEVEPFVGVNPTNPANVVAVYQQDRYSNGGSKGTVSSASFDGGLTWLQRPVPADTVCTGGKYDRASDPWISFGPDGVAHAMSLVTDADPPAGFGDNGMAYNRSTDGGRTWEPAQLLIEDTDPRFLNDKNSITADPNDPNFVYAVWDRVQQSGRQIIHPAHPIGLGFKGPIYFARTTNGGESWEPARKIYESGANKQTIGNQIVVEPASAGGSLFDFFGDIVNASERRKTFGPVGVAYIRSDNQGASWTKPAKVADQLPMSLFREDSVVDTEPVACPDPGDQGACPIRAGDLLPEVAVDPNNGNLYVVWMDVRFDGVGHDQIAFTMSDDGGLSWSAPIKVNRTPTTEPNDDQQAFTPSVDVAEDGTVTVSYYDLRNNTPSPASLDTDHWAVHCHPATEDCALRASWTDDPETRITPASFNIREAPFARGYFVGDYVGLADRVNPTTGENEFVSLFGSSDGLGPSSIFSSRLEP
jgi:hypothetical protein